MRNRQQTKNTMVEIINLVSDSETESESDDDIIITQCVPPPHRKKQGIMTDMMGDEVILSGIVYAPEDDTVVVNPISDMYPIEDDATTIEPIPDVFPLVVHPISDMYPLEDDTIRIEPIPDVFPIEGVFPVEDVFPIEDVFPLEDNTITIEPIPDVFPLEDNTITIEPIPDVFPLEDNTITIEPIPDVFPLEDNTITIESILDVFAPQEDTVEVHPIPDMCPLEDNTIAIEPIPDVCPLEYVIDTDLSLQELIGLEIDMDTYAQYADCNHPRPASHEVGGGKRKKLVASYQDVSAQEINVVPIPIQIQIQIQMQEQDVQMQEQDPDHLTNTAAVDILYRWWEGDTWEGKNPLLQRHRKESLNQLCSTHIGCNLLVLALEDWLRAKPEEGETQVGNRCQRVFATPFGLFRVLGGATIHGTEWVDVLGIAGPLPMADAGGHCTIVANSSERQLRCITCVGGVMGRQKKINVYIADRSSIGKPSDISTSSRSLCSKQLISGINAIGYSHMLSHHNKRATRI